jgi:polyhydroxybutyrate depolymerase
MIRSTQPLIYPIGIALVAFWFSMVGLLACSDSFEEAGEETAADISSDTGTTAGDTAEAEDAKNNSAEDVADTPDMLSSNDTTNLTEDTAILDVSADDSPGEEDVPSLPPEPLPTEIGGDRPAAVHVPDNVDESDLWPLVILLHGYTASGFIQNAYLGISGHVTDRGFILVIPEGTIDAAGNAFWNATYACCNFYGSTVDDEGYLSGLIDEAIEKLPVDANRVSLFGHSNGGFMSYRMACTHADQIAAIADIAGATYKNSGVCNPSEAVSVLHIHGTADPTIPYDGSQYYPSAQDTVDQWIDKNGCDPDSGIDGDPISYDKWVPGAETQITSWSGCDQGTEVALWKMVESGHIPSFDNNFIPDVLDFLLSQSLQGTTP